MNDSTTPAGSNVKMSHQFSINTFRNHIKKQILKNKYFYLLHYFFAVLLRRLKGVPKFCVSRIEAEIIPNEPGQVMLPREPKSSEMNSRCYGQHQKFKMNF